MNRRTFLQSMIGGSLVYMGAPLARLPALAPQRSITRFDVFDAVTGRLVAQSADPYQVLADCASQCGAQALNALPNNLPAETVYGTQQQVGQIGYTDGSQTADYQYLYPHSDNQCSTVFYPYAYSDGQGDLIAVHFAWFPTQGSAIYIPTAAMRMTDLFGRWLLGNDIQNGDVTLPDSVSTGDVVNPVRQISATGNGQMSSTNASPVSKAAFETQLGTLATKFDSTTSTPKVTVTVRGKGYSISKGYNLTPSSSNS